MAGDNYTYDQEGLQHLLDRHVLNYDSIVKLVGDSLSIFAAEHARQYFDPKLHEEWDEHQAGCEDFPTTDNLKKYMHGIIYKMSPKNTLSSTIKSPPSSSMKAKPIIKSSPSKCPLHGDKHHGLSRCPAFMEYDVDQRNKTVRDKRLCINCLSDGHGFQSYPSKYSCRVCSG